MILAKQRYPGQTNFLINQCEEAVKRLKGYRPEARGYVICVRCPRAVNVRNSLKSLAVSSDSEPEVEPFITQTKATSVAVQQELSEKRWNLHLRVQKTSKQLTISIFAPRIFQPTCMFTDKEDSGRGITTVTDKEIQSRNEARIPQNTKRSTTCLHGVHEFGMTEHLSYHDSGTFVEPENFKQAV